MAPMANISLSEEQKQNLQDLIQSAPELIVHRARLILAYAEGRPTLQAALQAGISRGRARYWKRQFASRGMDIFSYDRGTISEDQEANDRLYAVSEDLVGRPATDQTGGTESSPKAEVPYPSPLPAIGVLADDSLAEAGRKVWLYHFAIMLSHEPGTLRGEDNEELHDMRVATRRMRSAFDVFGQAFDPKTMKHHLKGLRGIGRALGQVRDMDVILEKARLYQDGLKEPERRGMDPLLGAWMHLVEKKRYKLVDYMQSEEYERFKHCFNEFLQPAQGEMDHSSLENEITNRVRDIVPVLVYSRYAAVRAYETLLPNATVSQLHALRIEFKKFRYTLEYFRDVLGETASKAINELKQYQDHLGELHDADVACQLVRDFLKRWEEEQSLQPINMRVNPETVVSYLSFMYAERHRLTVSFPHLWQRFNRPEFRHHVAQAISLL